MDYFLNLVACTEQYRFCSSISGKCTSYRGLIISESLKAFDYEVLALEPYDGGKHQDVKLLLTLVDLMMPSTTLTNSIQSRGAAALQATRYLADGFQFYLEPNQWRVELESWFRTSLARFQLEIFNTIERPQYIDEKRAVNAWDDANTLPLKTICGRIKFRSPNHTSISSLGLILILTFSGILMIWSLIGLLLSSIKWTKQWTFVIEWERDDMLALLSKIEDNVSLSSFTLLVEA